MKKKLDQSLNLRHKGADTAKAGKGVESMCHHVEAVLDQYDAHLQDATDPTRGNALVLAAVLEKWLAKQRCARTVAQLQAQLDRFRAYYNEVRPHRALGRRTPAQAFAARTKASPRRPGITVPAQHRVRRDRVDSSGVVTLRYQSRLRHLGIGRRYAGTRVMLLVADRDVRVINEDGEFLAE